MAGRRPLRDRLTDCDCGADWHFYRLAEHRHFYPDVHQRRGRVRPAGVYDRALAGTYCSGDRQLYRLVDSGGDRLYFLRPGAGDLYLAHR